MKTASLLCLSACCAPSPPATAWTTANANCACTGANTGFPPNQFSPFNNVTMFPANYGKTCAAWDQVDCPAQWWGTWKSPAKRGGKDIKLLTKAHRETAHFPLISIFPAFRTSRPNATHVGDWCCDSWCYVDQSCSTAVESTLVSGLYWSSTSCVQSNATCPYACGCKSNGGFPFTETAYLNRTMFPTTYGNTCKAWEKDYCAEMWPGANDPGAWCCEEWCYVDEQCPTAIKSWANSSSTNGSLYWSYLACGGDDDATNSTSTPAAPTPTTNAKTEETCKWEPDVSCKCTGTNEGFPFDTRPLYSDSSLFPATYGESCKAWETDKCDKMWPSQDAVGDWCCQNWCYVSKECPYAQRSWTKAELFWTWKACDTPTSQIDQCTWEGYYDRTGFMSGSQLAFYSRGEIGAVALDTGAANTKVTRKFIVPGHGFNAKFPGLGEPSEGFVPVLLRSPLKATPKLYSLKITNRFGHILLPNFLEQPAEGNALPAYPNTATGSGFIAKSSGRRRNLLEAQDGVEVEEEDKQLDMEFDGDVVPEWMVHARRLLKSRGGFRGGSYSSRSSFSSRSYSSRTSYSSRSSSWSRSSSSRTSYSSSSRSGYSSTYSSAPSSYRTPPTFNPPAAYNDPNYKGPLKKYGSTANYNPAYQSRRVNTNGYRYSSRSVSGSAACPRTLTYAADGTFLGFGVMSYRYSCYGSMSSWDSEFSDHKKVDYDKRGYGVPVNTRNRPGEDGTNWFEGDMIVGNHGYSGLAFRGVSRAAPFDKFFVNFESSGGANSTTCPAYDSANASAVANSALSYACKLQAGACAELYGEDAKWCDVSTYVKGATRPSLAPQTNASTHNVSAVHTELKKQLSGYLDCLDGKDGKKLVSCPVNATADYMLDALFGYGVVEDLDVYSFPLTVEITFDPTSLTETHAGQPNLMFTFLKAATVAPEPSENENDNDGKAGSIAGPVAGAICGVLFIGAVGFFVYRHGNISQQTVQHLNRTQPKQDEDQKPQEGQPHQQGYNPGAQGPSATQTTQLQAAAPVYAPQQWHQQQEQQQQPSDGNAVMKESTGK